ncbi:hypothetical protein JOD63_002778 [Microbacterium terrae]|uniref:Uncharacterized protein n=1 Tax=Microbacterium terrae TaxID=69369 RepID=A0A0M2H4E4_9MICO|nr:hypothetical protein [Microbacterium terrae]KJL38546.1 hypothetical protein RS81_02820 [Microbacterium terrae]MBP1078810.1 hypothetical protein [Microbacterium terrae]GLJ98212.1 hypothetical protein GCM10017594_14090 [Microbacterium terrae]
MLDAVYLATTIALFALVALIATAVERMGPHARPSSRPEQATGEERR